MAKKNPHTKPAIAEQVEAAIAAGAADNAAIARKTGLRRWQILPAVGELLRAGRVMAKGAGRGRKLSLSSSAPMRGAAVVFDSADVVVADGKVVKDRRPEKRVKALAVAEPPLAFLDRAVEGAAERKLESTKTQLRARIAELDLLLATVRCEGGGECRAVDQRMQTPSTPPPRRSSTRIPTHLLRELAVLAGADPRSVLRVVRGERLRVGAVHDRIVVVLRERGIPMAMTPGEGPR